MSLPLKLLKLLTLKLLHVLMYVQATADVEAKFKAQAIVDVAIVHASGASPKAASILSFSCTVNTNTVNAAQSTSCAARKAAAIDTVATTCTNAESAAEDGNKLIGIPTSNGGNTRPSAIQLQTAKAAAQFTVASLFSISSQYHKAKLVLNGKY